MIRWRIKHYDGWGQPWFVHKVDVCGKFWLLGFYDTFEEARDAFIRDANRQAITEGL